MLWLPFVVSKYIHTTGDKALLTTAVGFLESRPLNPDEDSLYDLPVSGNMDGTLYEHCVRAIKHSLRFGKHGLPLIGSGDWNDGMDQVGNKGYGESVWLAFFLYDILIKFADLAADYGDITFSEPAPKKRYCCNPILKNRVGTGNGISVHILMMEHHWDPKRITNAALMPLHKAGRYCPEQQTASVQV